MAHRCGAPTSSGSCDRLIPEEAEACFMHTGDGPPNSHGAPIGNTNAIGNSGGGAPVGNTNALKYGSWSDPEKHYERLEGKSKQFVDELIGDIIDRSKADLPQGEIEAKARRLASVMHLENNGWAHAFDEGLTVEREREVGGSTVTDEVVHPAVEGDFRLSSKVSKLYRELRLYPSPDGRPWSDHE